MDVRVVMIWTPMLILKKMEFLIKLAPFIKENHIYKVSPVLLSMFAELVGEILDAQQSKTIIILKLQNMEKLAE